MTGIQKIKRTALALALLAVIAASFALTASAASVSDFTDVKSGAWYYDAVSYVASRGLFSGTTTTTFTPNGVMTRGMFITVLGRYAGVNPADWCAGTVKGSGVNVRSGPGTSYSRVTALSNGTAVTLLGKSGGWYKIRYGSQTGYIYGDYVSPKYHSFSDVSYGDYYAGYVIWGYEKGIAAGVSATQFAPNQNVTREQMCRLLSGYVNYAGISFSGSASVSFTDEGSISSWAKDGVAAMARAEIIVGEKDGSGYRFRPQDSATRAQAASIFQRLSKLGTSSGGETPTAPPSPSGGSTTPAPLPTGSTDAADTPATLLDTPVSVKADTVRVGILADNAGSTNAVASVTLRSGSGAFEYGYYSSDRRFQSQGSLSAGQVTVTTDGSTFTVKNSSGETVYTYTGSAFALRPSNTGCDTEVNGGNWYLGGFELRQSGRRSGYITVVNYVSIETYVKGVIPYEFGTGWPTETLKAAAVCARNYVMTLDWSANAAYGFDVMPNSSAQTYKGRGTYSNSALSAVDAAVDATAGLYLTYSGSLCTTFYHSSCGGATEDSAHIWGGSYGYLVGKIDPYEAAASGKASYYTQSIACSRTGSNLSSMASKLGLSTIAKDGIRVETYPATGNVKSITITDVNGKTATIGQNTSYGRWSFLYDFGFTATSYRYTVTYNESDDSFTCTRYGWGHNVGLSQWGAYAMATYYGKNYQDILGFYFTGTHLQRGSY